MNENNQSSVITAIQDEHQKITDKWMRLHYHTFIGLVFFGVLVEFILGLVLFKTGFIEISFSTYYIKYILSPLISNIALVLIGIAAMHSPHLQRNVKLYVISTLFVGVCFVLFSIHCIFGSLYLIFTIPILLTVVYGNYALTTFTALFSIGAKVISELFVKWDPDKISVFENEQSVTDFSISLCILTAFYVACIVVIRFEKEKNAACIQKEVERYRMEQQLMIDELTGIFNRTALRVAFQDMEKDLSDHSYIFVMIDLDNFKKLNDTLGHDRGDQCLKEFGKILTKHCSDSLPVRFGGDEFCILFQDKPVDDVIKICQMIQNDLKKSISDMSDILLTASIGIAHYTKQASPSQLLRNTDIALYRSKEMKNTICVYEQPERTPPHSI